MAFQAAHALISRNLRLHNALVLAVRAFQHAAHIGVLLIKPHHYFVQNRLALSDGHQMFVFGS